MVTVTPARLRDPSGRLLRMGETAKGRRHERRMKRFFAQGAGKILVRQPPD
jgi:hypothetical protein